jgi:hypothetical protein
MILCIPLGIYKGQFTLHNFCLKLSHATCLQLELYCVNQAHNSLTHVKTHRLQQTYIRLVAMLFQQLVNRMCSHCLFPACWQVVYGFLGTCYKVVELNRLVIVLQFNTLSTSCEWQACSNLNINSIVTTCWQACYEPVANTSCWEVVRFCRSDRSFVSSINQVNT